MDFINAASAGPVADSTITVAHDCGSGDDRWLFVAVPLFSAGETPTVSGVTYDGEALSAVVQAEHLYAGNGNVVRAEWWALDLAAAGKTGTNNVVVTLSGAADSLSVIAFTATDCAGPSANTNTAGGNLSALSAAVGTAGFASRVVGVASWAATRSVTPGTGNAEIEDVRTGGGAASDIVAWAGWEAGTGGSVTWDITLSSAVRSAAAVMELLPVNAQSAQVAASGDDIYFRGDSSGFQTTGHTIWVGAQTSYTYNSAYRFLGVTIPAGATITAAYIRLLAYSVDGTLADIRTKLSAALADDPAMPATAADANALTLTTAKVDWDPAEWVFETWYQSPSLVSVIQELVDAYPPDNAAILIVHRDDGTPATGDTALGISTYDSGTANAPWLHLEWTPGEGGEEPVEGELDASIGEIALAASGSPEVAGEATLTLAAFTLSAQGAPVVAGALAAALGDVALAAAGTPAIEGELTAGIGEIVISAAGAPVVEGEAAATIDDFTLEADGSPVVAGALAAGIGGITLAATGTAGNINTGTLLASIGDVTLVADGSPVAAGMTAGELGEIVLLAEGVTTVVGAAAVGVGSVTLEAGGTTTVTGTLAAVIGPLVLTATGVAGVLVVQVYSARLPAQPSPARALKCNVTPGAALASQPSPAVEAKIG